MLLFKGKTAGDTVRAEQVTETDMGLLARYAHGSVMSESDSKGGKAHYLALHQKGGVRVNAGAGDWLIRHVGGTWDVMGDTDFKAEYSEMETPENIALTDRKFDPAIDEHRPWRESADGRDHSKKM